MHVTLLSGGLSSKQANGPTSTSQLKPASDIVQNSGSSFPSQAKRRKRERGDHGADSIKRERSSRLDDGDSVQCKTESKLKHEIARITEKGGVVNLEGVDKLVQLMHPDRKEGKMDLVCRSMLASVLASTDKVDCLSRFVQRRGLPVLDEWLQDIHKGKIGDANYIKDGDKSVDEFLLVLLHALDKLPVNLQALQMCNIGRSVNHLRSHKNTDIQKKARTLVDTWKKRVEAEMINIDATKSGSTLAVTAWPSKSRLPEDSHGGARTPSGSGVAMKSSITQNSAAKTTSSKSSPGDSSVKYEASSPGPVKPSSSLASGKESQPRSSVGGSADVLQIREDSSSSNQSHNHGQVSSAKDDQKSSPSDSVTVNKISSSSSRNKKNSGLTAISATGSQKGASVCKSSSAHKSIALEKFSHSALASERVAEGPITEGSSHKLVVKMSNCASSPARGVSGVSLEDATYMSSQAPSSALLNKEEQAGHVTKHKSDASRSSVAADMKVRHINDPKDVLTVSEGARLPAVLCNEVRSMNTYDPKGLIVRSPINQLKLVKLNASSFSPMNALIESCARYSEATSSLSLDDDVGMNLLASVAAGEMSRSDVVSPTDSTERSTPAVEEVCSGGEAKSRSSPDDCPREAQNLIYNDGECDGKEHAVLDWYSDDRKSAQYHSAKDKPTRESSKDFAGSEWEINEKSNEKTGTTSKAVPLSSEKVRDGESHVVHGEKTTFSNVNSDSVSKCASDGIDVMVTEQKDNIHDCKPKVEVAGAKPLDEGDDKLLGSEGLNRITISKQKLISTIVESEFAERASNGKLHPTECGDKSVSESDVAVKEKEPNDTDSNSCMIKPERLKLGENVKRDAAAGENLCASVSCSTSHDLNSDRFEKLENLEHVSLHESRCPDSVDHETLDDELIVSKSSSIQADVTDKCASTGARAASFSAAGATDPCTRIKLDLNEDFCVDDEKYMESVTSTSSCSTTLHMINSLSLCTSSIPSSHSASVTVASAAIRRFVPPEDLLRGKVELGWKGSAASSAFRSAETRKVVESNLSCPDASTSKNNRIPLDIDLNVIDEGVLEEMAQGSALAFGSTHDLTSNCATLLNEALVSIPLRSSGGLGLDLNIIDEASDTGYCSTSSNHHGEASIVHVKPISSLHVWKDFDLNNGPAIDDASAEQFSINQVGKGGAASQLPSAAGRTRNSQGPSSFTSWFSPGNTYSTVGIPSILPDRGDQPFHVFTPGAPQRAFVPAGVTSFNPDMYRGSVLSSAPAVPFPSSPSQFPVFPFGTTFPLPSANFPVGGTSYPDSSSGASHFAPSINSQYLGPVGNVASQFQRPYLVGLPNISNNGGLDSNQKWGRQGLDLNAGPGAMESEVKEEMLPYPWGQHYVASFQALAEEQARMFSVSSGSFKRKEPEGGLNKEPVRHRYSSWQ